MILLGTSDTNGCKKKLAVKLADVRFKDRVMNQPYALQYSCLGSELTPSVLIGDRA